MGLLALDGLLGALNRSSLFLSLSPAIIHPYLKDVDAELMAREQLRGRRVHVWTVNVEVDMRRLQDLGVDGVFTDDPITALRVLRGK
mgnify:FL=1